MKSGIYIQIWPSFRSEFASDQGLRSASSAEFPLGPTVQNSPLGLDFPTKRFLRNRLKLLKHAIGILPSNLPNIVGTLGFSSIFQEWRNNPKKHGFSHLAQEPNDMSQEEVGENEKWDQALAIRKQKFYFTIKFF